MRSLSATVMITAILFAMPQSAVAQPRGQQELSAETVRESIRLGVNYLLNEQSTRRGTWNEYSSQPGGVTSLCTLALLNSGVPVNDPKIQKSLAYLRTIKPQKIYSVALQTMALCEAQPKRDMGLIQRNVKWLEDSQITQGPRKGAWAYPDVGIGDNSNAQFAVLALHEAERVGAQVDPRTWQLAADYWKGCQNPDGSWGYQPDFPGTGSMTCAGIGAWVISSGKVAAANAKVENGRAQCCLPRGENDVLDLALRWLGRNFSVKRNPGERMWQYYYLYGMERVGRLTARRFIGEHDWYREGAEHLIAQQDNFSHNWVGQPHAEDNPHIATALALLFLSKGRRPILVAKLEHGLGDDWNRHASDIANLTAFTEKQWGMKLTWQVVDPNAASVEDLLQAPVLYLSGSRRPQLAGLEEKTRDYIDRGGFLFAEACCAPGGDFEKGLREFLDRVFPEQEYQLTRASPSHPIWRIEQLVRPDSPYVGKLWTVEYGCRTCVVFSEADLSCYWELYGMGRIDELPETVRQQIDDANAVGVNVLAYATNREPKGKEATFDTVAAEDTEALGDRGAIRIAKLLHGGGCNDAPGALINLLRTASQGDLKLRVSTSEYLLRASDPSLLRFRMAFMHGRHDFRFTEAERTQLREFLENGGLLLADSICGSKPFADAFRREIQQTLPDAKLTRIAPSHPIFTEAYRGFDIRQVALREPATPQPGETLQTRERQIEPLLEGIEIDGRLAVIFSPYDISCALEQHEALQCRGYTQEDAARIALNVLMYALSPDAVAAP